MKKIQILYFLFIGLIFFGCNSQPIFTYNKNQLYFNVNNQIATVKTNGKYTYKKWSSHIQDAYTIEDKDFHLEYISLNINSDWTGAPYSHYSYFLKNELKGFKQVSHTKLKNADLYKYEKNEKYFYLISIWNATEDIFIVDYSGEITSKIVKQDLQILKTNKLDLDERLKKSLLDNYFNDYFERDSSNQEIIILPI